MTGLRRREWFRTLGRAGLGLGLSSVVPLAALPAIALSTTRRALAFGEDGAFHPRLLDLDADGRDEEAVRGASRWAWEVVRRTSAPGRLSVEYVEPAQLLEEPFILWAGRKRPRALDRTTIRRLRAYLRLGGMVVVDDREPLSGEFTSGVKAELAKVLPEAAPVAIPSDHVLFKTFYLVDAPLGRIEGPRELSGIVLGNNVQVLFLQNDLLGALVRTPDGSAWAHPVEPGGPPQREQAVRLAVNIAMYVLCSDYKDDQVHAPFLMRRRSGRQ